MADQRVFGNTDKSPAEAGTQVRDKVQEAGAQVHDKAQEAGTQVRDRVQEVGAQVRDTVQEASRQVADTASEYYQQGRQQVAAAETSLEDAIRTKPLQSVLVAAGLGMLMAFLFRK
jgi:ElaB/YqjD/DUF883 family membrane-anchored ribosome-binding protein